MDWPVTYQELEAEFGRIERLFQLQSGPNEVEEVLTAHEADQHFVLHPSQRQMAGVPSEKCRTRTRLSDSQPGLGGLA